MDDQTIAAIATPLGEGGLAVIRVSGDQAIPLVDRCFLPGRSQAGSLGEAASHTLHYGRIQRHGEVLDEVLVAVMRAPRTFTREDVVEISCHGGVLVAKLVLDAVLAEGARLAHPGEFTRRAFVNGRIDLTQAEAVADLIQARTDLALRAAHEQLAGHLSRRIDGLRNELMSTLAHVEAHIDFPDEDIAPDTMEQLTQRLAGAAAAMERLLATAEEGRVLRRGIRAALIGRPNAGKSSLLNRLLGEDRAIVSALPGTTRDTIEETANIRGIPVVFIDTAGLRETADEVEGEGVRRSRTALERADLVLQVLDQGEPWHAEDKTHWEGKDRRKWVVVRNKSDLPARLELPPEVDVEAVPVSCLTGEGLDSLKERIRDLVWGGVAGEMVEVMINARHQDALRRALAAASRARGGLEAGETLEVVAMELREAVQAVGEVVGKTTTEDLLDSIFSQFCLGK